MAPALANAIHAATGIRVHELPIKNTPALARTREGILRYNAAVGVENTDTSGYHETLTRFRATVLQDATRGCADEWQAACHAVERFGEDRDLHTLFYSFDVVRSIEARRGWIAPDVDAGESSPTPGARR